MVKAPAPAVNITEPFQLTFESALETLTAEGAAAKIGHQDTERSNTAIKWYIIPHLIK
jgi:hypothetical protein